MLTLREKWNLKKIMIIILVIAALYWSLQNLPIKEWSFQISDYAQTYGLYGAFLFGLIYIIATVLLFPCAFLTFAAGMAYGFWAVPLVIIAASLGACIAFVISRFFVKEQIEKFMEKRKQTHALKIAIEEEGWKFLILIRISPFVPFNLNNYFLGTIRVSFWTYLWATIIGCLPGTTLYVYLGILGQQQGEASVLKWLLFFIGVLATYALTRITLKKTKQILRNHDFVSSATS